MREMTKKEGLAIMRIYSENEKGKKEMKRWRSGNGRGEIETKKERIDRENRLNQRGCVLVRGANGEERNEPQPPGLFC